MGNQLRCVVFHCPFTDKGIGIKVHCIAGCRERWNPVHISAIIVGEDGLEIWRIQHPHDRAKVDVILIAKLDHSINLKAVHVLRVRRLF